MHKELRDGLRLLHDSVHVTKCLFPDFSSSVSSSSRHERNFSGEMKFQVQKDFRRHSNEMHVKRFDHIITSLYSCYHHIKSISKGL